MPSKRFVRAACRAALLALAAIPASAVSAASPTEETILEGWVYEIAPTPPITGASPPAGTVVAHTSLFGSRPFRIDAYLRDADGTGVLAGVGGGWCLLRGVLHRGEFVVPAGASPRPLYDVLDVGGLRAFPDPLSLRPATRGAILRDLFARGVDYARDGTATPAGGLDPSGRLPGGRRARRVPLVTPPADSADMRSETALIDVRGRRYWAVREGGFRAAVEWVGPFEVPPHGRRRGERR